MTKPLAWVQVRTEAVRENLARLRQQRPDAVPDLSLNAWGHGAAEALAVLTGAGVSAVSVSRDEDVAVLTESAARLGVQVLRHRPGECGSGLIGPELFGLGSGAAGEGADSIHSSRMPVLGSSADKVDDGVPLLAELRPALRLRARIVRVKTVAAGEGVSYGHRYITERPSVLALAAIGYADGMDRAAGGRVSVAFRGRAVPVVGRVAMNVCVLRLGDAGVGDAAADAGTGADLSGALGETVDFLGDDPVLPTAASWARALGAEPATLTARLSVRLSRRWL